MARLIRLLNAARRSPRNLRFTDLCALAEAAGFAFKRQSGSHRIYVHPNPQVPPMNFQERDGKAKPYQVKQLLFAIEEHRLLNTLKGEDP
ncbi:MAG: type II toxin-antitoxin system HicA family toxin [Alphaproteobacteria bacterium]|nr:type II toxin-antitoxin system HicA family toxin [Alphaproteobacteria bacterium]